MISSRRSLRSAAVAVVALSLAACGGSHPKPAASSSSPTPTPTATAPSTTTAPAPVAAPAINPFTGGKPSPNGVVAVKIDDTANGRPQVNIDKADVVYIEQVEGGLTRLLAVYDTTLPTVVEAVRSTRANDPELMAQYGPVAYVASGGAPNPLQVLARSNLKVDTNDGGGPGFARDNSRSAPYNLTANLALIAKALHPPKAKSIGFTFAPYSAAIARTPRGGSLQTVVGSTPVRFVYDAVHHRYVRVIDGVGARTAAGVLIATPNVLVQFCSVTVYPQDVDVLGNPSMYTHTVGKGAVILFRDGHRIAGTWSRPTATAGTTLRSASGAPLALAPGGVWVVLVATGAPLTS